MQHCRALVAAALIVTAASSEAHAACAANSGVFGTVAQTTPTSWLYSFSVQNGCHPGGQPFLTDFYLPYFSDAGIGDIVVPTAGPGFGGTVTWSYSIDPSSNLFGLAGAGVIDFHVAVSPEVPVGPSETVPGVPYYGASGFSFTADYGSVEGPYALREIPYDGGAYSGTAFLFGDPPIPGSPLTIDALSHTATPEPATLTLVGVGLLATVPLRRRRRTNYPV